MWSKDDLICDAESRAALYFVTKQILQLQMTTFNISLVVHGTVAESNDFQKVNCKTACYYGLITCA